VGGNITDTVPYGKLCGSKTFSYTSTFGPFKNCNKKQVRVSRVEAAGQGVEAGVHGGDVATACAAHEHASCP
jgi:tryptophan synthase beta subunit